MLNIWGVWPLGSSLSTPMAVPQDIHYGSNYPHHHQFEFSKSNTRSVSWFKKD